MIYSQVAHQRGQSTLLQHLWAIGDLEFRPRKERDEVAVDHPKTVLKDAAETGEAAIDRGTEV